MSKEPIESQIYLFVLKLSILFYLADVLLNTGEVAVSKIGIEFNFLFILKLVLLLAFFIVILAINKNWFKRIAFLSVIFGSLYKILDIFSSIDFTAAKLFNVAPYVFIAVFSFYYLYRSYSKKLKYKNRTKHKKLKEK